jgi:multidrug efflux pump subunit AcrA (membrane-fusion protein)
MEMRHGRRWIAGLLIISGLVLSGCASVGEKEETLKDPATLEPIEGSDVSLVRLTEEAAVRLDIEVHPVLDAGTGTTIPYAAVFYTATGDTWTYTNPEPLAFVRVPIVVDHIRGDRVFLSDGPPSGVSVVTQGSAELYGTETGVEE